MTPSEDPYRTVPRTPPAPTDDTPAAGTSSADPNRTGAHAPAETPAGSDTVARTPSDVARLEEDARTRATEGVPGYALLRELGRGGMGVVYEARHLKLDHVVALKTLLGAARADRADVIRFLAEAQAVAAIKHENVVQVYDYGEANGRPFMALEYCPGGTLGKLLPKGRDSAAAPREMAALIAKVARGVAAAHARGIIHRDLKPGNVFLDEAGAPKVADFGLAKRGTGEDVTKEGVGMGTPAYMAPEQAHNAKFVGPQADVWALGVMLYQALTGTRPFTGNMQEILAKAQNTEPLAPRKVVASVPRDLELICLHCLAKAPHERYATAKELADDLDRYARGEPISVRPAGPIERGYKWVKRNPVVSGAVTAVVLALSVGTGVSVGFGLDAKDEAHQRKLAADRADDEAGKAKRNEGIAVQRGNELAKANDDLKQKQTELVEANKTANVLLARKLLAPFPAGRGLLGGGAPVPLQIATIRELASLRGTPLPYTFLDEGTKSPLASKQLESRAAHAIHAAIGLDPELRVRAEDLFLARLDAPDTPPEQRISLALACSYLEPFRPGTADRLAKLFADEIAHLLKEKVGGTNQYAVGHLAQRLAAVAGNMEPGAAVKICTEAANRLAGVERDGDFVLDIELVTGLPALTTRMKPEPAAALLVDRISKAKNPNRLIPSEYAEALAAVAARLEPAAGAAVLIDALKDTSDRRIQMELVKGLTALAPRLAPPDASAAAKRLADAMDGTDDTNALSALAAALFATVSRAEAGAAATTCDAAVRRLADVIDEKTSEVAALFPAVTALAGHLEPAAATAAAAKLVATMDKTEGPGGAFARAPLTAAVAALAARMVPDRRRATCEAVALKVTESLNAAPAPYSRMQLARGLAAAAGGMDRARAVELCDPVAADLTAAMKATSDPQAQVQLAMGLAALAAHTDRAAATERCEAAAKVLGDAIANNRDVIALVNLAQALAAVSAWTGPARAAERCGAAVDTLVLAMGAVPDPGAVGPLAAGVAALVPRMDPARAATACAAAARAAGAAESRAAATPFNRSDPSRGLIELALQMEPVPAAEMLLEASIAPAGPDAARELGRTFSAVVRGRTSEARRPGTIAAARAAGAFAGPNGVPGLALLHPNLHPQPKPLPPQALVDLLKHPFCTGQERRAVLDALEAAYGRTFADQWEFVRYVQGSGLPLDLLKAPNQPPQPVAAPVPARPPAPFPPPKGFPDLPFGR